MQYVTIAHNGNTSLQCYHTRECAALACAKNPDRITKERAEQMGLELCSQCDGPTHPDSHDTRHIDALRAAGGD